MPPLAAFTSEDTFSPTPALIVGPDNPMTRSITLLSGQNCVRGTVLGKIATNAGAVTVGAPVITGTGTGALTRATPAYSATVQEGTYTVLFTDETTNAGEFVVLRPDGTIDGYGKVAVAYDGQVKFTIADSTDYLAGDTVTLAVTIADTSAGKYVKSLSAAVNGSQTAVAILAEDCDASLGDKVTVAYMGGVFDENALTYGTAHTAATVRESLRDVGIKLNPSIT